MEKLTRYLQFSNGEEVVIYSSNPRQLYKQYLSLLRKRKHPNKFLQELYDLYGAPRLSS